LHAALFPLEHQCNGHANCNKHHKKEEKCGGVLVRENGSGGPCSSSLHKIQITSRIHPRIRVSSAYRASLLVCLLFLSLGDTNEEVQSCHFYLLTCMQWLLVFLTSLVQLAVSKQNVAASPNYLSEKRNPASHPTPRSAPGRVSGIW
jgi:hypothetical protein